MSGVVKMNNDQKQVLVLEDEPSLLNAIDVRLKSHGINTTLSKSAKEGIEIVKKRATGFDGIWLDFDILGFNGLEFMKQFREIPGWEKTPVLIVSNTGDPAAIKEAIELGARKWIVKAEARLEDIIQEFIQIMNDGK